MAKYVYVVPTKDISNMFDLYDWMVNDFDTAFLSSTDASNESERLWREDNPGVEPDEYDWQMIADRVITLKLR